MRFLERRLCGLACLIAAAGLLSAAGCPTLETEQSSRRSVRSSNPARSSPGSNDSSEPLPPIGPPAPGATDGDANSDGSGSGNDNGGGNSGGAVAPLIRDIADAEIALGAAYSSPEPTLESGTPPVFWSLSASPDGAAIDNVSGRVVWSGSNEPGTFSFEIRATNAAGSDTESWNVTVASGAPPPPAILAPDVAEIADVQLPLGVSYTGPRPTLLAGTPPVFWSLVGAPDGAVIDNASGVVSWPGSAAPGEFTFRIRASNSVGFDEESWLVRVIDAGVAPLIAPIDDAQLYTGQSYVGPPPQLLAGTLPVSWSLVAGPTGALIAPTGVVIWDATGTPGDYLVTIRAQNAAGFDDESWFVRVLPAVPPEVAPLNDVELPVDTPYVSAAPTLLAGTPPVFWSLSDGPDGSNIASATGVVSWIGSPNAGDFTFRIRATNSGGFAEVEWTVHVVAPAQPDIAPLGDAEIAAGEAYTLVPALLAGTPPIDWSLEAGPAGASADPLTGQVEWSGSATPGDFNFTLRASNAAGFDTESWTVRVVEPPVAPDVAPIDDVELAVNEAYVSATPALLAGTPPVFWSLIDAPEGAAIDFLTGVVTWPGSPDPGDFPVTIRATNGSGFDDESWTLHVFQPPVAPDVAPIDDAELLVDTPYVSVTPTLLAGTPPVFWSLIDGPAGAAVDFLTGVVTWPGSPDPGDFSFTIQASNAQGFDQESWTVHVTPPQPPDIAPIEDVTLPIETPYVGVAPTLLAGTPPVFWSLLDGPEGAAIDFITGVVTWPGSAVPGDFTFAIQASNAQGFDAETWQVHVVP